MHDELLSDQLLHSDRPYYALKEIILSCFISLKSTKNDRE